MSLYVTRCRQLGLHITTSISRFHCTSKKRLKQIEAVGDWLTDLTFPGQNISQLDTSMEGLDMSDGRVWDGSREVEKESKKLLQIIDRFGSISAILRCPSLEHLKLLGDTPEADCVENIGCSCPRLKRVEIGRKRWGFQILEGDGADGLLEVAHETIEELKFKNLMQKFTASRSSPFESYTVRTYHACKVPTHL